MIVAVVVAVGVVTAVVGIAAAFVGSGNGVREGTTVEGDRIYWNVFEGATEVKGIGKGEM